MTPKATLLAANCCNCERLTGVAARGYHIGFAE